MLCCRKRPKDFNFALRKAIRNELDVPLQQQEVDLQQNPLLVLGFGINAYFQIIKAAFILMLVCMLANLPLIYIYSSYSAYSDMPIA